MSKLDGEKANIKKFFSDEFFFNIPCYQRAYSWEKEQVEQLFDDINCSDRNNEYFLGTIVLQKVRKIGSGHEYDIIDGQQRITTLQILLACLRDSIEDIQYKKHIGDKIYQESNPVDGIPEKYKLQTKEEDFFKKYVQLDGAISKVTKETIRIANNDSQINIINAICILKDKISEELTQEQIKSLSEHISQKCVIMYISAGEFEDAYRLFIVTNDRGLQLRRVDILKADNLHNSLIPKPEELKKYSKIWEDIETDLGVDNFEKLISFIRTIEIKEKAKDDILKEFNNKIFGKNRILRGIDFINYLYEYKNIYQELILDRDVFDKNEEFKKYSVRYKHLVSIMFSYLPSNEWIPPVMYFYKKYSENKLFEFLIKLERKFVADWIIGVTPTKRIININAILKKIDQSAKCDEVIKSETLEYNKVELRNKINEDIYDSKYIKYILFKLEYLESEQTIEKYYDVTSVERILPEKPKKDGNWYKNFNEDEIIYWRNKIANLILLSKRKNSSAKNFDFEIKKEKYFKDRITDLGRSQKILRYSEWNPEILSERQNNILNTL